VALRKELAGAGHDAGAETIAWYLRRQAGCAPSVSAIWRILSRRGFVTAQPHKRPRSSWRRFEASLPNELWQADITHWPLADGSDAEILNIVDDHSRLLAGCTARRVFTAADVVAGLHLAIGRHGRPERMLTDNGAVFTGLYRGRGWVALERELTALGIGLSHCRPYHPQTCGKVERFQCATMRAVVSPVQSGGTRREVPGSDGLPGCRKVKGTRACQLTRGRVQVSGTVLWGARVIRRKLDCLNPNLQKMEVHIRRKDAWNRRRPCDGLMKAPSQPSGPGAMPSEGIEGDE
jgi:hypothetical protein